MDLSKAYALPSESTTALYNKLSKPALSLSEGALSLKDFIYIYVHTELLQSRTIKDLEQSINFRTGRSNKLVEEIAAIDKMSYEELKKHKDALEDSVESGWKNRNIELQSRKQRLEKVLLQAKKLEPPTEDFDGFFLYIKNHIKTALFRVEEAIASDPKPKRADDVEKWRDHRLHMMKLSMRENDRIVSIDSETLQQTKEWLLALSNALDEQLGPTFINGNG